MAYGLHIFDSNGVLMVDESTKSSRLVKTIEVPGIASGGQKTYFISSDANSTNTFLSFNTTEPQYYDELDTAYSSWGFPESYINNSGYLVCDNSLPHTSAVCQVNVFLVR